MTGDVEKMAGGFIRLRAYKWSHNTRNLETELMLFNSARISAISVSKSEDRPGSQVITGGYSFPVADTIDEIATALREPKP